MVSYGFVWFCMVSYEWPLTDVVSLYRISEATSAEVIGILISGISQACFRHTAPHREGLKIIEILGILGILEILEVLGILEILEILEILGILEVLEILDILEIL